MLHVNKLMNIETLFMEYNSFYQICVYICHEGIVFNSFFIHHYLYVTCRNSGIIAVQQENLKFKCKGKLYVKPNHRLN